MDNNWVKCKITEGTNPSNQGSPYWIPIVMENAFTLKTDISLCSNGMVNLSHNTLQTKTSKKTPQRGVNKENNVWEHTVGPAIRDVPESTIAAQPPSHNPVKCFAWFSDVR